MFGLLIIYIYFSYRQKRRPKEFQDNSKFQIKQERGKKSQSTYLIEIQGSLLSLTIYYIVLSLRS